MFGVRKHRDVEPQDTLALEQYALHPAGIPSLETLPEGRYALPGTPLEVRVFKGEKFNQKELEQQLRRSASFTQMMARSELDSGAKRPLLPLSISQIGLIGGSGMIDPPSGPTAGCPAGQRGRPAGFGKRLPPRTGPPGP